MSAPRKLTDDQIDYVRRVSAIKRRIVARLRKLPTNAAMAEAMDCSQRLIERLVSDGAPDSSTRNHRSDRRIDIDYIAADLMRK
jgi:hypothetical protein